LVTAGFDRHLEQRRPTAQLCATQTQQQPAAVTGQAFDFKAFVLARDGHVGPEVEVVSEHTGEWVRLRITIQAQGSSVILEPPCQARHVLGVRLNGQVGQQIGKRGFAHLAEMQGLLPFWSSRRKRSRPQASSPDTQSQSPVTTTPDRLD